MARVAKDHELGCAAACRGADSESAVRWEDDRDGGDHQVGSDRPGYASHGSRPDLDTGSVQLLIRRPLEYGAGFRGFCPPGSSALRRTAIARGVGAAALAVVLAGLR